MDVTFLFKDFRDLRDFIRMNIEIYLKISTDPDSAFKDFLFLSNLLKSCKSARLYRQEIHTFNISKCEYDKPKFL